MLYITSVCIALCGCGNIEDTYKEFTEGGEIVYVAKADSLKAKGGNGRIELSWLLLSDPKVSRYVIYWNNYSDSISGSLIKTTDVDTVKVLLQNMPEEIIYFDVVQYDDWGHRSIKSSVAGQVYGENYQNTLLNRAYKKINFIQEGIEIEWASSSSNIIFVEAEYLNMNSEETRKILFSSSKRDTLFDVSSEGFRYRTAYLPEELAIDTFYCDYSSYYKK